MLIGTLKHDAAVGGLRFSSDGQTLTAMVRTKKKVVQLDVKARKQRAVLDLSHIGYIKGEAYSGDGRLLVTSWVVTKAPPDHGEEWVRVWNLESGKETVAYRGRDLLSPALSPDSKLLAVIKRDDPVNDRGIVILLDAATGKELTILPDQPGTVYGVGFSPDSKTLVTEGWDYAKKRGEVRLWDIETRKVRTTLTGSVAVMQVLFAPDGKTIATWSWDELSRDPERKVELKLWDAATGKEKAELKGHRAEIMRAAFSPDGKVLATGGGTMIFSPITPKVVTGDFSLPETFAELKLWDVATGKERANLSGHENPIYIVQFSPDGRLLASSRGNEYAKRGELRLWDVGTGKKLAAPDWDTDPIGSLAFSPDGKLLATGGTDGIVRLWDVSGVGRVPPR